MTTLDSKNIALLATDGFEDSELTQPMQGLKDAGAQVTVISNKSGTIEGKNGTEVSIDATIDRINGDDFDALLLPGGVENPDTMRQDKAAVAMVKNFVESGKPVAAICHAPWLLVEAGVVNGRTVTSWPSLVTDLKNAGATWQDQEVVVDDNLITSRNPDDIPVFTKTLIEKLSTEQSDSHDS